MKNGIKKVIVSICLLLTGLMTAGEVYALSPVEQFETRKKGWENFRAEGTIRIPRENKTRHRNRFNLYKFTLCFEKGGRFRSEIFDVFGRVVTGYDGEKLFTFRDDGPEIYVKKSPDTPRMEAEWDVLLGLFTRPIEKNFRIIGDSQDTTLLKLVPLRENRMIGEVEARFEPTGVPDLLKLKQPGRTGEILIVIREWVTNRQVADTFWSVPDIAEKKIIEIGR